MADTFTGLIVGGPMAGQNIVHDRKLFRCEDVPRRPLLQALKESVENPDSTITTTIHTYRWHHLGPFAIWIHESLDLNTALEAMAMAYSEKHHGNPARR